MWRVKTRMSSARTSCVCRSSSSPTARPIRSSGWPNIPAGCAFRRHSCRTRRARRSPTRHPVPPAGSVNELYAMGVPASLGAPVIRRPSGTRWGGKQRIPYETGKTHFTDYQYGGREGAVAAYLRISDEMRQAAASYVTISDRSAAGTEPRSARSESIGPNAASIQPSLTSALAVPSTSAASGMDAATPDPASLTVPQAMSVVPRIYRVAGDEPVEEEPISPEGQPLTPQEEIDSANYYAAYNALKRLIRTIRHWVRSFNPKAGSRLTTTSHRSKQPSQKHVRLAPVRGITSHQTKATPYRQDDPDRRSRFHQEPTSLGLSEDGSTKDMHWTRCKVKV